MQLMYVLFGSKWSNLFCGPLWSVESTEQGSSSAYIALGPLTLCSFNIAGAETFIPMLIAFSSPAGTY